MVTGKRWTLSGLLVLTRLYQYDAFVNTFESSATSARIKSFPPFRSSSNLYANPSDGNAGYYVDSEDSGGDGMADRHRVGSNNNQNNNGGRHPLSSSSPPRSFTRKYDNRYVGTDLHNVEAQHRSLQFRQKWLLQATKDIVGTTPGTLIKGKWHELISMMKAWSKYAKVDPEAPVRMERLVKRLLDERAAGNEEAVADIDTYNLLLDAWCCAALFRTRPQQQGGRARALPNTASQRAREILVLLQENFEATVEHRLIQQQQAESLVETSQNNTRNDPLAVQPNEDSFSMVFDVVLKVEGLTGARRVLAWMEYIYKMGRNDLARPGRKYYVRLLDAYSNSRSNNAGTLAEAFLRHMNKTGVAPDTLCYNIAIKAWTKSKRGRESAEHADRILEEMQVPKDLITYSTVISAWGASGMRSHAVARAEKLLRDIEDTPHLEPNTIVLNSVMSTWVKSRNPQAANRTGELLEYMQTSTRAPADLVSYNTHLHALSIHASRRPGDAQRATDILESLEDRYRRGMIKFRPNLFSYNIVIDAWARSQDHEAAWNAVKVLRKLIDDETAPQPDTFSFNQVLTALSRSNKQGAARLAEQLLDYMEDAYNMKVLRNAKADVVSYTSVIVGLARSGESDAPERAERLLQRLKEEYHSGKAYMKPNRFVYNSLIDAWAKSGKGTYGARKAEALLKEMNEICASSGDASIAPNVVTYNSVVNSWARSGTRCCGNKAEEYLDRMWQLYESQGEIKPNDKTFNTVINAVSKSQHEGKAQKALRILRRMDKLYQSGYKEARPNALTYTTVLNAAAFPATSTDQRTRRKALDTAIFTLQELQSSRYGQPNEITYCTFIKACSNLLSDDDETLREVIEETFHQCKVDGQLGDMFLRRLREAAPEDLYRDLLADVVSEDGNCVRMEDLPPSWYCNVRDEKPWLQKAERPMKATVCKKN